jgi:hypothetical protein
MLPGNAGQTNTGAAKSWLHGNHGIGVSIKTSQIYFDHS